VGVFAMSSFKVASRSDTAAAASVPSVDEGSTTVAVAITEPATVLTEQDSSFVVVLFVESTRDSETRILEVATVHRSVVNLSVTCEMDMSTNLTVATIAGAVVATGGGGYRLSSPTGESDEGDGACAGVTGSVVTAGGGGGG
jgi:hypothetical protein